MKQNVILLLCLFAFACQSKNENKAIDASPPNSEPFIFSQFDHFPERQFKTIQLGQTQADIIPLIAGMPVTDVYNGEISHFLFPADSTELLIPNERQLTEFKVYLKSRTYLGDEAHFRAFLGQNAQKIVGDSIFSIFYFENPTNSFKVTYFYQTDYIRLHFILLTNHS